MTTRFTVPLPPGTISSGYSNQNDVADLFIPSCGLEDVDVSLFELFDKEIPLFTSAGNETIKEQSRKKVPVIFAAGEKWSLLKNNKPLRDRSDTLILPLVTIMRTGVEQSSTADITGRGINQQTGELTITRRLSAEDRNYQNLINKLYILNQQNVAVNPSDTKVADQVTTLRDIGQLREDVDVRAGALLLGERKNNVWETITMPAPQFFSAKYEVTFWTQYTQQMNQLVETLMSSYLPQGRCFKLLTPKGYWFVAYVEEAYTQDANYEDTSNSERIIKYKFTIRVPAYLIASSSPGVPVPLKRYISSPTITFSTGVDSGDVGEENLGSQYPFLGSDDPTLPSAVSNTTRRDMRDNGEGPLSTQQGAHQDPALEGYPRGLGPGTYKRSGSKLTKQQVISKYNGETVHRTTLGNFGIIID